MVRAIERVEIVVPGHQVRCDRQPFEVVGAGRPCAVGDYQLRVGLRPGAAAVARARPSRVSLTAAA
jgi:hypothetical protein